MPVEMKKCPKCGAENSKQRTFCYKCHTSWRDVLLSELDQELLDVIKPSPNYTRVGTIALIGLVFLFLYALLFFWMGEQHANSLPAPVRAATSTTGDPNVFSDPNVMPSPTSTTQPHS
jgi:hypothetical protein